MIASSRRTFLYGWPGLAAAGLTVVACRKEPLDARDASPKASKVTAAEDLMREHGVLRRALVVYREAAQRLRTDASAFPPAALLDTARLFREFGEDYHERKLEEAFVFSALRALQQAPHEASGAVLALVDALAIQHRRGRELTDYFLARSRDPKIGADAEVVARALESFARMYEAHAASEDTVIFPAWKAALSATQLDEMGDRFEEIERRTFGDDGFERGVQAIAAVERQLGLEKLSSFTAPPAPTQR